MTPWQCYCKSVQTFLPNLNFSCKESDFGPQMRRLNSETISIFGGIWGGFLRIARTFNIRKRNSIVKFSMGVTVEVDNQRNCLVMCLDQMARFAITSFPWTDFPPSFLKSFYDISISLCMNELFVATCCKDMKCRIRGTFCMH